MLVNLVEVLKDATLKNYAVPAFNTWDLEVTKAIVKTAEEMLSPVIIMTSGSAIKSMGLETSADIVSNLAKNVKIPVVLHLDHSSDPSMIFKAMKAGYTSVMYDGSMLDLNENIKNTIEVLRVARALNVSVEAEVGQLARGEEGEVGKEVLTSPIVAKQFIEQTGIDALAVAIGTCHGMQTQSAHIHKELAKEISDAVATPLVLHGSSGVKDEDVTYLASLKFGKINFGTRLKNVFTEEMRVFLKENPSCKNYLDVLSKGVVGVSQVVRSKIMLTQSANKA